jgi:DNA-binding HxlR family transcriptional regulator
MAARTVPADPPLPLDALQAAVGVLAAKWSLAVIAQLASGTSRFNELARRIDGVSRRMLSTTLRQLERDGLVLREVHAIVPARVDYALSPSGRQLLAALVPLASWGTEHGAQLVVARERYDRLQSWRSESSELQARTQATPRIV